MRIFLIGFLTRSIRIHKQESCFVENSWVICVPRDTIWAKDAALQHLPHEDVNSCASLAVHQKIASIPSFSFSQQRFISSPVTVLADAPGISSHHLPSSALSNFLEGKAFFSFPSRVPSHEKISPMSKWTIQIRTNRIEDADVEGPPKKLDPIDYLCSLPSKCKSYFFVRSITYHAWPEISP